jgi:hypothetical protein
MHPAVAFDGTDTEREVPHPQFRVATLVEIGGGPTPVLDEKKRQAPPGRAQVGGLGIERQQHVVGLDTFVERIDEADEEIVAAHVLVQRHRSRFS